MNATQHWKTEEYHGFDMHVLTCPRQAEHNDLPGHGHQWDFVVHVTNRGDGPDASDRETAQSDPDIFYSTQAIAENMGFIKGRELIEGRAVSRTGENRSEGRIL